MRIRPATKSKLCPSIRQIIDCFKNSVLRLNSRSLLDFLRNQHFKRSLLAQLLLTGALSGILCSCTQTQIVHFNTKKHQDQQARHHYQSRKKSTHDSQIMMLDPYEKYNRLIFKVNWQLDRFIFKPAAVFYKTLVPTVIRQGINRIFSNLDQIPTLFNHILQGRFHEATVDIWRFAVNSTLGLGGLIDIASYLNVPHYQQDFGLTLAHWGYRSSAYFILPLLGPKTVRDTLSWPIDYQTSIYPYIPNETSRQALTIGHPIHERAQLLKLDASLQQLAVDPYLFQRNAYLQRRAAQIASS